MSGLAPIKAALDALPRARIGRADRERPVFHSLGVAGFHLALALTFGATLARGLSSVVTAVSADSFFQGVDELIIVGHLR